MANAASVTGNGYARYKRMPDRFFALPEYPRVPGA